MRRQKKKTFYTSKLVIGANISVLLRNFPVRIKFFFYTKYGILSYKLLYSSVLQLSRIFVTDPMRNGSVVN